MKMKKYDIIYIPTKEMISTVEHFVSLYDEYHIDFEEMYYDLAKLLDRPLSKGPNTTEQNQVLNSLENIMKGQIVQKNKKFYFKIRGEGEFEMGLLSDGYRKLSMIIYMILSGSLNKNTILFWDEPETAQKTAQAVTQLKEEVETFRSLETRVEDMEVLCELALEEDDESLLPEMEETLASIRTDVEHLELGMLLNGEYDANNAILTLHAGAGGTEAQDWTSMLLRMFSRFAEREGYEVEMLDYLPGDEAGVKRSWNSFL